MLTDKMDCGGAETHIFTLSKELCAKGHTVYLMSSGGNLARRLSDIGVFNITIPLNRHTPFELLKSYFRIRDILKNNKIDIVHSHARLPSLLASHIAKKLGIPFVTTVHASFSLTPLRRRLSAWGERTIAVSQDLKQYLTESYSLPPRQISVIPNGVDSRHFSPAYKGSERSFLRICFLSRLDSDSSLGALLLCRTAPKLYIKYGYFEIIIGGKGNEYHNILKAAEATNRDLGFTCIKLVGRVDDTAAFFRASDVFVGVSRCAIEAVFCNLSVVLCGNEGFFGRLEAGNMAKAKMSNFCSRGYSAPTLEKLFNSLNSIFSENTAKRLEKNDRLRRAMLDYCDVKDTAKRTEDFYKSLLNSRRNNGDKVLLCGYYGYGNMGDDAMLYAAIRRARLEFGNDITALTKRGAPDFERFGVPCISKSSPFALISSITKCKYFIFGGGTLLQASTSLRSLIYYSTVIRLAKNFGADCRMWGNGIGTLNGVWEKKLVKAALGACSYVGLRDVGSFDTAKRLLGDTSAIHLENDLAADLCPADHDRIKFLMWRLFQDICCSVRFIICAPKDGDKYALAELEKRLSELKEQNIALVFVAMHPKEDENICQRLAKSYGGKSIFGIDLCDLIRLAGYSLGVYSMRFHALLAARIAQVPPHPFGTDPKLDEFRKSQN